MESYNFNFNIEYYIQAHEVKKSRKEVKYNRHSVDEFLRTQCDEENQNIAKIEQQSGNSMNKFITFLEEQHEEGDGKKQPDIPEEFRVHHMQIIKNLKQRITDVIKERNSDRRLDQQVAILDSMRECLAEDPLKVLSMIGYQAIMNNDEFNIPKTSKNFCPEFVTRYERKRQELAETFCLLEFSSDVIRSCDEYDEDYRLFSKRLYEK